MIVKTNKYIVVGGADRTLYAFDFDYWLVKQVQVGNYILSGIFMKDILYIGIERNLLLFDENLNKLKSISFNRLPRKLM